MQYEYKNITDILKLLHTTKAGLSTKEVKVRVAKYGKNSLPKKSKKPKFSILIHQFASPLVYVLIIAAVISIFTNEQGDAYIIMAVVIINAVVGYYQESKAQNTLQQLREILPAKALVRRDGDIKEILAEELVPGDIIILNAGEKVVADARIIESVDLSLNEAFLTGESRLVKKSAVTLRKVKKNVDTNIVYAGSIIQYGQGEAVVFSTGLKTKLGSIARLVLHTDDEDTPLQKRIKKLTNRLVLILLVVSFGVFFIGILRGFALAEIFKIAVAIAVAAIPEGLLIAITVILAIGMQRILKQKALVRQLLAAETLGSTSVICADKTGTLTEGSMKVVQLIPSEGIFRINTSKKNNLAIQQLLYIAYYCNDAVIENYHAAKERWKIRGRPTDRSLMQLVVDNGMSVEELKKLQPRISYIPISLPQQSQGSSR